MLQVEAGQRQANVYNELTQCLRSNAVRLTRAPTSPGNVCEACFGSEQALQTCPAGHGRMPGQADAEADKETHKSAVRHAPAHLCVFPQACYVVCACVCGVCVCV